MTKSATVETANSLDTHQDAGGHMARNLGMGHCHNQTGNTVYADQIATPGQGITGPLTCTFCGTAVEARNGYTTQRGTEVRSYFALKRGHTHSEGCDFNYERRAKEIVERHEAVIKERGHYVLLLQMPEVEGGSTNAGTSPEDEPTKFRMVSTNEHGGVHPSLQAARSIARLVATFNDNPELIAEWTASYQGQQIAWPSFYYRADAQNADLARDLTSASFDHPRAVQGVVRQTGTTPDGSHYLVDLASGPSKHEGRFVNIRLGANTKSHLLQNLKVGDTVIGYGLWSPPWRGASDTKRESVTLWVHTASAVARIA